MESTGEGKRERKETRPGTIGHYRTLSASIQWFSRSSFTRFCQLFTIATRWFGQSLDKAERSMSKVDGLVCRTR
jgi:hypothetical protein